MPRATRRPGSPGPKRALLLAAGLLSLAVLPLTPALRLRAQPAVTPSRCATGLSKAVAPAVVNAGDAADVSMVVTHTCPAEQRPVDLVFLVDVSRSMVRGRVDRDAPAVPTRPPAPSDPKPLLGEEGASRMQLAPRAWSRNARGGLRIEGLDGPGLPPPGAGLRPGAEPSGCGSLTMGPGSGRDLPPPPGPAPPPGPGLEPPGGIGSPGDPSADEELPGGEDLIREAQRWIRDFALRPEIDADMRAGKLRLAVVSFNDRGRSIVSLTGDGGRVVSRLGVLRTGAGPTRLEQGLRKADQTLRQYARGNGFGLAKNRVGVVVVVSDGQFCSRDLSRAARVLDEQARVLALAAGRGANQRKLRDLVSERKNVLGLRDQEVATLLRIYRDAGRPSPIPVFDPVDMTLLKVRETLTDTMELVPGSPKPAPASITGQTIEWALPHPASPVTVSYQVRPRQAGTFEVATESRAEWNDTLGRSGAGDFPAVSVERRP